MPPARSLWRHGDFVKLWVGHTVSRFGSRISDDALVATAVLVLAATPQQLGWLVAVGSAPVLLIGLFAGVLVDRTRRRPVMIATDFCRALLLASIPVAYAFGVLTITQLFVVAGLSGVLTVFFDVADQSYLPGLVERENIPEGNSKLGLSGAVAEVAGPALGGTMIQLLSAPVTILIDAASFLVSAVSVMLIRKPEIKRGGTEGEKRTGRRIGQSAEDASDSLSTVTSDEGVRSRRRAEENALLLLEHGRSHREPVGLTQEPGALLGAPAGLAREPGGSIQERADLTQEAGDLIVESGILDKEKGNSAFSSLFDGLRLVFSNPLLRAMAGFSGTATFFGSFFSALYWPYAVRELGLGPALVGVLISVGGVSSLVGALLTGPVTRRFGLGRTMTVACVLGGIFELFIPLAGTAFIGAAAGLFVQQLFGDITWDLYGINAISLRQSLVPDESLGRANAAMNFIQGALLPVGAPIAGLIADHYGMRVAVLIAVLGTLASSLWIVLSPIRHLHAHPTSALDEGL
ncbi:MAG: MFS transporter [Chloroflexota bacterium]|nr:MFS transporter [Chloroflexota bacterium]